MDISDDIVNNICKSFAMGWTIEHIANIEQLPIDEVKQVLNDNADRVKELKIFYKAMEV